MQSEAKILITGAHGMLGKNTVEILRKSGYKELLLPTSKELDLRQRELVFQYFQQHQPTHVLHLAARVGGIRANMLHQAEFLYENILIDTAVIDAAKSINVQKLITMGSSCMYPRLCTQPMTESMLLTGPLEPTNEGYALAKIISTKFCQFYKQQYNLNCVTLVAPNLYGPYEKFDTETSHVISSLLLKFHSAKEQKKPHVTLWGTGSARREFLFAPDAAKALLFFMDFEQSSAIDPSYINIGSGNDISIKDLALLIKSIVSYQGDIVWDAHQPDGMPCKLMNSQRAYDLGWKPTTSLEEGIRQSYRYFQTTI